jgi:ketosteroid isomerase-like protein
MSETARTILEMERSAMDRWGRGDPDGFLEISDPDVVYFDPFLERRLNGRDALKALYDGLRGQVHIDEYEIVDPLVRVAGDMAVLTFNFVSHSSEGVQRWHTTEVYQRRGECWRIVHTHWSFAKA